MTRQFNTTGEKIFPGSGCISPENGWLERLAFPFGMAFVLEEVYDMTLCTKIIYPSIFILRVPR